MTTHERLPSLTTNAISNAAALAINCALAFFLTPLITGHISKANFGVLATAGSIVGYYGFLDLGVRASISRFIARQSSAKDYEGLNETASTAMFIFTIAALVSLAATIVLASPVGAILARKFALEGADVGNFRLVMLIMGLSVMVTFIGNIYGSVIIAMERYFILNTIMIGSVLVRVAIVIGVLKSGGGVVGVAAGTLAVAIISAILWYVFARRIVPTLSVRFSKANRKASRQLLTFGSFMMLISLADILRFRLDTVFIGFWLGMSTVGVYAIAQQIVAYAPQLITAPTTAFMPRFSRLDASERGRAEGARLLMRVQCYSAALASAIFICALAVGRNFIVRWLPEDYSAAYAPLVILLGGLVFELAQAPGVHYLKAANKHRFIAVAYIIEGICKVALATLFLWLGYGIVAVAVATVIPMAITRGVVHPIYVSRTIKVSLRAYWRPMAGPFAVAALFAAFIAWRPLPASVDSWPGIIGGGLAYGAAYLAAVYMLAFPKEERVWTKQKARTILGLLPREAE